MVTQTAELAIEPLVNQALGALSGPEQLDVLGHKLDVQVTPSAVSFAETGALVTMNVKALLEGSESSPGYIVIDRGTPAMDGRAAADHVAGSVDRRDPDRAPLDRRRQRLCHGLGGHSIVAIYLYYTSTH